MAKFRGSPRSTQGSVGARSPAAVLHRPLNMDLPKSLRRAALKSNSQMDYLKINKETWDRRTRIHVDSEFYDVNGFLDGETSLREIELAELRCIEGKSLLHLQCHFGLDTLSWARKGAIVTGVDLSPVAIKHANRIKRKANIEAQFICSDIYDFGDKTTGIYDVVFTSYGAINWLPCLSKWAETIAKSLKPGGMFYMVEFHPVHDLISGYAYFESEIPNVEEESTYTENNNDEVSTAVTWPHPLSEVINALSCAGIKIDQFNEFPFSPYNCFTGLEEKEPGRFYGANMDFDAPLVYSILGTKPA